MTDNQSHSSGGAPDVAAVLEQLRAGVRAQHAARRQIGDDALRRALQRSLDDLEITRVVSAHWPLTGRTLPQKAMALVNRVVRRYLRWYINPIVEQQNAFNDAAARTLRLLAEAYQELARHVAEQQEAGANIQPHAHHERDNDDTGGSAAVEAPSDVDIDPASAPTYADLMAQVRDRAAVEPPARFIELELHDALTNAQSRQIVTAHWPLTGRTIVEKAIALHNRIVRQYLRWLINPIVEQQNAANDALTTALRTLIRVDAAFRADVAAFRASRQRRR
jgi:predicted TIM-barrel fold metal-dependent hydrolase